MTRPSGHESSLLILEGFRLKSGASLHDNGFGGRFPTGTTAFASAKTLPFLNPNCDASASRADRPPRSYRRFPQPPLSTRRSMRSVVDAVFNKVFDFRYRAARANCVEYALQQVVDHLDQLFQNPFAY